eukprot:1146234-Pelagomonas_calceolata.AAC.1
MKGGKGRAKSITKDVWKLSTLSTRNVSQNATCPTAVVLIMSSNYSGSEDFENYDDDDSFEDEEVRLSVGHAENPDGLQDGLKASKNAADVLKIGRKEQQEF